jgi:predicted acetyltransferase
MSLPGEPLEIRAIREDQFDAALGTAYRAFGTLPGEDDKRYFGARFDLSRALGAFSGDRLVGTSTVLSLELTLPGGAVCRAGGLAWVTTLPGYGGVGVATRLVLAQQAAMCTRGEAVSILTASVGDLYRRFGYGPATALSSFAVEREHAAFVSTRPGRRPEEGVQVRPIELDEARTALPALYDRLRLLDAGAVSRSRAWWDDYLDDGPHFFQTQTGGGPLFYAVAEDEGGQQGYVSHRSLTEPIDGRRAWTVCVEELLASTTAGYAALWRYCLDQGLAIRVSCRRGRTDEPLRWLLADTRRLVTGGDIDHLWLCLLDVPAALAARGYAATGELVLGVRDPGLDGRLLRALPCPTYRLVVNRPGAGGAGCTPSTSAAEIEIDLADLGSVYLGNVSFSVLASAGLVEELAPGACARADRLFRTSRAPYCVTQF